MDLDKPLVLATHNAGKISEFKLLLSRFNLEIKGLKEFDPIPAVEEDGLSFEQNATKKARFTARVLGLPAIADDSGLMVQALNGMPGVYSARYAGAGATDERNNRKLLEAMSGVTERQASFVCVIAIAVPRGEVRTFEGQCEGILAESPRGNQGFGYDPLFYYPPLKKTFAQLTREEKSQISHRGRAMAELEEEFWRILIWLKQRLGETF
jgi:XTP/dITP diphosphohydrolase